MVLIQQIEVEADLNDKEHHIKFVVIVLMTHRAKNK